MSHPLVRKLETLARLSADDLDLLDRLMEDVRSFGPRQDIVRSGDRPDHVNLILEGWAIRYQITPLGTRMITAFLVPGDFCDARITLLGEMDHSIGTIGPTKVAFVSTALMLELVDRPAIARALWWASLVDGAVLRAWIVNIGRREATERVAHLICELHARLENVGIGLGNRFAMPLTQDDLGDALGLTNVHVNRVLRRLREVT